MDVVAFQELFSIRIHVRVDRTDKAELSNRRPNESRNKSRRAMQGAANALHSPKMARDSNNPQACAVLYKCFASIATSMRSTFTLQESSATIEFDLVLPTLLNMNGMELAYI